MNSHSRSRKPAKRLWSSMAEVVSAVSAPFRAFRRLTETSDRDPVNPRYARRVSRITAAELLSGKKANRKSKQVDTWGTNRKNVPRPASKNEAWMLAKMRASTQIGGATKPRRVLPDPTLTRTVTANQVARAKLSHLSNSQVDAVMKKDNASREKYYR